MQLKDYYKILELEPSASIDEIKKAYRRLAQVYHPDKNADDRYSLARFTEVKEAYETLTNPSRKALYLQQRWYAKSIGKPMSTGMITPVAVLQKSIELDRYVRTLDIHRMDNDGLRDYIMELLSDDTVARLKEFNDPAVLKEIVQSTLRTLHALPFPAIVPLVQQLQKLTGGDKNLENRLQEFLSQKRSAHFWQKKRTVIVLITVLLFCLFIFFLAKKS